MKKIKVTIELLIFNSQTKNLRTINLRPKKNYENNPNVCKDAMYLKRVSFKTHYLYANAF